MAKLIFSLNSSRSLGREYGSVNVNAHVDTLGRVVTELKRIFGYTSVYPNGGTSEQPVRKMSTSSKVGDLWGLSETNMNSKEDLKVRVLHQTHSAHAELELRHE